MCKLKNRLRKTEIVITTLNLIIKTLCKFNISANLSLIHMNNMSGIIKEKY